jgi:alcohol dehydrogenase class IV
MDILCHALESYTARWYTSYDRKRPEQRVPYCGSNPVSDMWSEKAMSLLATSFRTAVRRGDDSSARASMATAATFAGMGFGNAGVHIPHANGYPIAGRVRDFHPKDYPDAEPMVPHGMSVALTAPEAFRFTFDANPERHIRAAQLLAPGADRPARDADFLPSVLIALMKDIDIPNGVAAVGFTAADVPALVEGTTKQQRLLATCPKPVTEDDLGSIFQASMELW